jgi:hypothetical protein
VPDPRDPRGVIHPLSSLLVVAVAAVLADARSVAAIGERVTDAPHSTFRLVTADVAGASQTALHGPPVLLTLCSHMHRYAVDLDDVKHSVTGH